MHTFLMVLGSILIVYVIITILSTLCTFSVINKTGEILNDIRKDVYDNCNLKEFCESSIPWQLFRSFVSMGWIPLMNLSFLLGFIINKNDLVIQLASQYIAEHEEA